ncbi:MAG: hypothetical protein CVV24_07730 [Ignavibacteriae bacterium HGW-Ignavibacteriae-3]|nr:MAG: hypothetical protein CVV24_07730 [Ignavibacteriae bacterium HGW-Ignavibacteriae-3]
MQELGINKILFVIIAVLLFNYNSTVGQDCKAKVQIFTDNTESLIYIDSVLAGKGNFDSELSIGDHTLMIKNSLLIWGGEEIRDSLRIIDCGKKYLFTYKLNKRSLIENGISDITGPSKESNIFFNSGTFKILLGSAAVLGGVAAYLKIKADRKYDEYLLIKNQSILDEVNRLDLYSGISFGLLQINFGYLIYKFLTD